MNADRRLLGSVLLGVGLLTVLGILIRYEADSGETESPQVARARPMADSPSGTAQADLGTVPKSVAEELEKAVAIASAESAEFDPSSVAQALRAAWLENPDLGIPEMSLLTDDDWLRGARIMINNANGHDAQGTIDESFRYLRNRSRAIVSPYLRGALEGYVATHEGQMPAQAADLRQHLLVDIDSRALSRYGILSMGSYNELPPGAVMIAEIAGAPGSEIDGVLRINRVGESIQNASGADLRMIRARNAFAARHGGIYPTDRQLLQENPDISSAEAERYAMILAAKPGDRIPPVSVIQANQENREAASEGTK